LSGFWAPQWHASHILLEFVSIIDCWHVELIAEVNLRVRQPHR
jgi:hypothetical protein